MTTMTNSTAILTAVKAEPGKTAHYYATHYAGTSCRWGWVYAAFRRATAAGLVKARVVRSKAGRGWFTTYIPAT